MLWFFGYVALAVVGKQKQALSLLSVSSTHLIP
jgi:DNA-binding transcriptional regulator YdaS (Cro superfamily)